MDPAPVPSKYYLSETYVDTLIKHKARHASKGNGFGYEIRDLDGIAGTIVCGGMGRERNLIIDHREHSMVPTTHIKGDINGQDIRKMTPREWARLQGFPDTYKLMLSDTHLYKQFGNSVSVNVIEAIAKNITTKEITSTVGKVETITDTSRYLGKEIGEKQLSVRGATFEGTIYRNVESKYNPLEIDAHNIDTPYRYSPEGIPGLYFSSSERIVKAELANYDAFDFINRTAYSYNAKLTNMLDVTNP